jgi:hypothetical protein
MRVWDGEGSDRIVALRDRWAINELNARVRVSLFFFSEVLEVHLHGVIHLELDIIERALHTLAYSLSQVSAILHQTRSV